MEVVDGVLELGGLELAGGGTLPGARIAYQLHGTLAPDGGNVIVLPHMYSGTSASMAGLVGAGRALDPERFLIVCPGQLGNGVSTSPSTTGLRDGAFPDLAPADDAAAQSALLDHLGVRAVHLAVGYSMGAQQAYALAALRPDLVRRIGAIAGTARTTDGGRMHVRVLAESLGGRPAADALRVHAHVWAALGLGAGVYREEAWRDAGYASADDMVERLLAADYTTLDRDDLLCQLGKWSRADVDAGAIAAPVLALALAGDVLFPPDDVAREVARMPRGAVRVLETPWGHYGAAGMRAADAEAVEDALAAMVGLDA